MEIWAARIATERERVNCCNIQYKKMCKMLWNTFLPEIANKYTETHENTDTRNHRHSVAHKYTSHTDKQTIKCEEAEAKQKNTNGNWKRRKRQILRDGQPQRDNEKKDKKGKGAYNKVGVPEKIWLRSRSAGMNILANEEKGRNSESKIKKVQLWQSRDRKSVV